MARVVKACGIAGGTETGSRLVGVDLKTRRAPQSGRVRICVYDHLFLSRFPMGFPSFSALSPQRPSKDQLLIPHNHQTPLQAAKTRGGVELRMLPRLDLHSVTQYIVVCGWWLSLFVFFNLWPYCRTFCYNVLFLLGCLIKCQLYIVTVDILSMLLFSSLLKLSSL